MVLGWCKRSSVSVRGRRWGTKKKKRVAFARRVHERGLNILEQAGFNSPPVKARGIAPVLYTSTSTSIRTVLLLIAIERYHTQNLLKTTTTTDYMYGTTTDYMYGTTDYRYMCAYYGTVLYYAVQTFTLIQSD